MKNLLIALLLGAALGATGLWFVQKEVSRSVQEKAAEASAAAASVAQDLKRTLASKLETLELRSGEIRSELEKTGQVVRRKAREVGEAAADAAADARITAEIKGKLTADAELSVFAVSVATTNGRVTLSGKVSSPELIGKAILLALEVDGVRDVVSTIQLG